MLKTIPLLLCFITLPAASKERPSIQLANNYTEQQIEIKSYWVSEKLDGIRGYWNGEVLISRQGNVIHSPKFFTEHWPNTAMDGELWLSRNAFEATSACVATLVPNNDCWQKLRFMVFDLPAHKGNFTERINAMKKLINATNSPYLQPIEQIKLSNEKALTDKLNEVIALNGEGLMLHHQAAYYRAGRSNELLKVKKRHDAEAQVIGYLAGKGKFKGMMGALTVKTPEGIVFNLGSGFNLAQRQAPPSIGTVITYQYFGKTAKGIPRFASFLRIEPAKQDLFFSR